MHLFGSSDDNFRWHQNFMNKLLTALVLAFPAVAMAQTYASYIPTQFQGVWASTDDCALLKSHSSKRTSYLKVGTGDISSPTAQCIPFPVTLSDTTHFSAMYRCIGWSLADTPIDLSLSEGKLNAAIHGKTNYVGIVSASRCMDDFD